MNNAREQARLLLPLPRMTDASSVAAAAASVAPSTALDVRGSACAPRMIFAKHVPQAKHKQLISYQRAVRSSRRFYNRIVSQFVTGVLHHCRGSSSCPRARVKAGWHPPASTGAYACTSSPATDIQAPEDQSQAGQGQSLPNPKVRFGSKLCVSDKCHVSDGHEFVRI